MSSKKKGQGVWSNIMHGDWAEALLKKLRDTERESLTNSIVVIILGSDGTNVARWSSQVFFFKLVFFF